MITKMFLFFTVFSLFWATASIFLDPDFGWHLKIGQFIVHNGIPKTDPFSYTMPSYPFVDHEWLTDVFIAKLYPFIGISGLAFISACIITLALFLSLPNAQNIFIYIPYMLAVSSLIPFAGIRPQIITWLFLTFLFRLLTSKKNLWLIPPLFLLWANLHGGFQIGIAVFFVFVFIESLEEKRIQVASLGLLLLSAGTTLINPYGMRLLEEVWRSTTDASLRWSIGEWLPAPFIFDITLWLYTVFSVLFIWRYRKKMSQSYFVSAIILFLAGITSIRNIPLWILASLPLVTKALYLFFQEAKSIKDGAVRLQKAQNVFLVIALIALLGQAILDYLGTSSFQEKSFYPKQAVLFLKENHSAGNIFSDYGWGGYLIWKLPEKKVFIDGRMPSWKSPQASTKESTYAFGDYQNIVKKRVLFSEFATKYNIDTLLWHTPKKQSEGHVPDTLRKFFNFLAREGSYPDLIPQVIAMGWHEIYHDNIAVIYQKQKSNGQ